MLDRYFKLQRGKRLLAGYKSSAVDYVNVHWYNDADTFEDGVAYLKAVTGLPVVTNEIGQQQSTEIERVRWHDRNIEGRKGDGR